MGLGWTEYKHASLVSEYDTTGPGDTGIIYNYERFVETDDGRRFHVDCDHGYERESAIALATVVERFPDITIIQKDGNVVPTEIAIHSNPAVACYLMGAHQMSIPEVADKMDVSDRTVRKYFSRFKPYTES